MTNYILNIKRFLLKYPKLCDIMNCIANRMKGEQIRSKKLYLKKTADVYCPVDIFGGRKMELKGKTINFLGDSITQGVGTTEPDKVFHQIILREYGLAHANNYGISGTRMARQTAPSRWDTKFDLDFVLRAEVMDKDADAVVVFGGTNDYGHGDAHFGNSDDTDVYTFCGAVNSLITKLREKHPNAEIVFMTPLHRTDENEKTAPDMKMLEEYVEALRAICKKEEIPVIDLFEINPLNPHDELLVPDGLHPSDEGHKILAEVVARELLKI